jgi:AraC-like DNA-binding protein
MSTFMPAVVNLWKTIESYGINPAPFFEAENLKIQIPPDPCQRVPYEKVDRIRTKALAECGDEAFGIRSALCYVPSQSGALGYALLASTSVRSACLLMERYIRVLNITAKVSVEDRDSCMVVTPTVSAPSKTEVIRDDTSLAVISRICQVTYGEKFRLEAVNFKRAEPSDIKPYHEFFGCTLNFNQNENQILIPQAIADEVLISANPQMAMMSEQIVTQRLAKIDQNDIVTRVQAVFTEQLPLGTVSDDSVAEALHMSVRTLHRKLADESNNFRAVLVETRRRLADQYIMDNSLTLTEISLLLGFSEQSSFSRAFKTWTGSTPSELRQARQSHQ